jgi:hypothetical protein
MRKLNRRELTRAALSGMAAASALQAQPGMITHGPLLGHVTKDTIHIWGRTARPGEFRVRYGTDPNRLDQLSEAQKTTYDHLHNSFAAKVTDKIWEFCSGPHNSRNHPAKSEGGRPANGMFDSRGRMCEIRWSSYFQDDVPAQMRRWPNYAVATVNNVYENMDASGKTRYIAYPKPHVVIQYYHGVTGDLEYAESIHA